MPKFTIIVPMYNAADTIGSCYQSVRDQKLDDYEVLFIDDGSEDETVGILSSLIGDDSRARIISLPHTNAGHCRNVGIEAARGDYLAFCDADDYLENDLLNVTLQKAEETGADIVGFNYKKVYDDGSESNGVGVDRRFISEDTDTFSYGNCPDFIFSALTVACWAKIVRRDFVLENGIRFDEIPSANDMTFSALCLAKAETISVVNNRLYCYRIGDGHNRLTRTREVRDLLDAVGSTIRQITACEHYEDLKLGLWNFIIYKMIHVFIHNVYDWDSSDSEEFYRFFREYCQGIEVDDDIADRYAGDDVRYYVSRNYRWYRVFREKDYSYVRGLLGHELIYSFTSFPARIGLLKPMIDTVLDQSRRPDRFILWLADSQFPKKEEELPGYLLEYAARGELEIRWCRDLKPHKKYFYAMKEFPDSIIVVFDDDLLYRSYTVEDLLLSYIENPDCVSTLRTHLIARGMKGEILPYEYWPKEISAWVGIPSMQLCPTNGAGSLFPPHILDEEFLDEEVIEETCLTADDLWLKAVEVLSGVPAVQAARSRGLRYSPDTQEVSLFHQNTWGRQNDVQMENIRRWIDGRYGEGYFTGKLFCPDKGKDLSSLENVYEAYSDNNRILQDRLRQTYREKSAVESLLQRTYSEKSEINAKLQQSYSEKSEINAKLQQTYAEKSELNAKLQQSYSEKSELSAKLQQTYAEKSELNAKLQQSYEEKSEANAKLQQTYAEKSELNAKLQQTYAEKSELNAKLQQTYSEKSELNAKLKQTYSEKSELNATLKEVREELRDVSARLKEYEDRDLRIIMGKVVQKLKK